MREGGREFSTSSKLHLNPADKHSHGLLGYELLTGHKCEGDIPVPHGVKFKDKKRKVETSLYYYSDQTVDQRSPGPPSLPAGYEFHPL